MASTILLIYMAVVPAALPLAADKAFEVRLPVYAPCATPNGVEVLELPASGRLLRPSAAVAATFSLLDIGL